MNGHEQIRALIAVYDSLNREERAKVERHAKTCPSCRASLTVYQRMDASLGKLVDPQPETGLRSDFYARLEAERPKQNGFWSSLPAILGQASSQLAQVGILLVIAAVVFSMWLALRSRPNQPAAIPSLTAATPQSTVSPTSLPTATIEPVTATPSPSPIPPAWTIELQETLSGPLNVIQALTIGPEGKFIAASGSR
jgi:anti-sigma factor RsiW